MNSRVKTVIKTLFFIAIPIILGIFVKKFLNENDEDS